MIINTESVVGYNNNLTKATDDMKLGVNNHVNVGTKNASLKLMAGGPSKINPPNSHPLNPIHEKATEAQRLVKKKPPTQTQTKETDTPTTQTQTQTPTKEDSDDTHHINKALVGLGALVFVGFVNFLGEKAVTTYSRFFSLSFWIMKAATARISSQAFLARN